MNYNDMTFTDNDREKLEENKLLIINWIKENIIPFMDTKSEIKCDFGEMYKCSRTNSLVASYHFYVFSEPENFYSGLGETTKGIIGYGQKFKYIKESFESVYSPYDIYPVVDNWTMIKQTLLNGIREQAEKKKTIHNFEV